MGVQRKYQVTLKYEFSEMPGSKIRRKVQIPRSGEAKAGIFYYTNFEEFALCNTSKYVHFYTKYVCSLLWEIDTLQ